MAAVSSPGLVDTSVPDNTTGLGCWAYSKHSEHTLFWNEIHFSTDSMTGYSCYQAGLERGTSFFALGDGGNCYLGNTVDNCANLTATHDSNCRTPCKGDKSAFCGGSSAVEVYAASMDPALLDEMGAACSSVSVSSSSSPPSSTLRTSQIHTVFVTEVQASTTMQTSTPMRTSTTMVDPLKTLTVSLGRPFSGGTVSTTEASRSTPVSSTTTSTPTRTTTSASTSHINASAPSHLHHTSSPSTSSASSSIVTISPESTSTSTTIPTSNPDQLTKPLSRTATIGIATGGTILTLAWLASVFYALRRAWKSHKAKHNGKNPLCGSNNNYDDNASITTWGNSESEAPWANRNTHLMMSSRSIGGVSTGSSRRSSLLEKILGWSGGLSLGTSSPVSAVGGGGGRGSRVMREKRSQESGIRSVYNFV